MPADFQQVRPARLPLTDADARHLLAEGLIRACHRNGPAKVAAVIACDEKTVRRARDEESTLKLGCAFNLLDIDPNALDALAAAKGFVLMPMVEASGDMIAAAGASIHSLAQARSPNSEGGLVETDNELIAMAETVDALATAVFALKSRIAAAKARRAGHAA